MEAYSRLLNQYTSLLRQRAEYRTVAVNNSSSERDSRKIARINLRFLLHAPVVEWIRQKSSKLFYVGSSPTGSTKNNDIICSLMVRT